MEEGLEKGDSEELRKACPWREVSVNRVTQAEGRI